MNLSELELPEFLTTAIDASIEYIYSYGPAAEKTVVLGTFLSTVEPRIWISVNES